MAKSVTLCGARLREDLSATLALALTFATNQEVQEFVLDREFVKALLNEALVEAKKEKEKTKQ